MSHHPIKSPRKLIEVALPLDAINAACVREKSIRHGHPSTLHLWWARRPLAAARAVIFAQLVNDPGYQQGGGFKYGVNKKEAAIERKRLFKIIEDLVLWENTTNEEVLERARAEIRRSWREVCELNQDHPQAAELFNPDKLPALHDPFAGGGAIPLEAQRLGLEAYASDLNPVAVLINKAMIEIPPKFANRPPVSLAKRMKDEGKSMKGKATQPELHPSSFNLHNSSWPGATGLAEDVRYYGAWMRAEAQKRIGHLYPPVKAVREKDGSYRHATPQEIANPKSNAEELTVIAWLWARTVKSPNPAFSHVAVPLASTFILSSKEGKESYVHPIIEGDRYRFTVKTGTPPPEAEKGTKLARGANFRCLLSDAAIEPAYIKAEGIAKRMGARLMAVVAEGARGRVYLEPTQEMETIAASAKPTWKPELSLPDDPRNFWTVSYGLTTYGDLFTPRQLVALTTFSDLVAEARQRILADIAYFQSLEPAAPKLSNPWNSVAADTRALDAGGSGPTAYAEAVSIYLAFAISKLSDRGSSICTWFTERDSTRNTFARQSIPMTWDFAELNTLLKGTGSFEGAVSWTAESLEGASRSGSAFGFATQADAQTQKLSENKIVSTDPPYYDNIGYADLSDFFYVWLRKSLREIFPSLLATIAVPKAEELVATPYRHGSKEKAESFFLDGMTKAMSSLSAQAHPAGPITIYYAFKQSDTKSDSGTSSTGWETFLDAVHRAGLQLLGTWPMRTELGNRMIGAGNNALASSIVLVCRKRPADAPTTSRREFQRELNAVLPEALDEMTRGNDEGRSMKDEGKAGSALHNSSFKLHTSPIAPVDLSQAIIGPGMAVFSKYAAVLEADGSPMSVRTALQLINRFLAEDDFDHDTQFCLHWFEQHGWTEGVFGEADTLARAKGTSVEGVKEAGVIQSGGGKVRLLKWAEYPADWNPSTDTRLPVWEALHQIIRAFRQGGDTASGALLAALGGKAEAVRQLAYRLYTLCERLGQAEDARAYNELITSWTGIEAAATSASKPSDQDLPGLER
jgi:putative DNA methylase